jgi:hypothetical protein
MPELPDVELFKRHLDATCLGRTIRRVTVSDPRILSGVSASELERQLSGARLSESGRHGKHLLVGLQPPGWLTMHFGMNGSLRHFTEGERDPPYDRVRFDFYRWPPPRLRQSAAAWTNRSGGRRRRLHYGGGAGSRRARSAVRSCGIRASSRRAQTRSQVASDGSGGGCRDRQHLFR